MVRAPEGFFDVRLRDAGEKRLPLGPLIWSVTLILFICADVAACTSTPTTSWERRG